MIYNERGTYCGTLMNQGDNIGLTRERCETFETGRSLGCTSLLRQNDVRMF